ncbi:ATP synthase F1 subunit gamma [Ancylomarina euxinus]|uniref:ATP synthase gamma chain n=1 Tax=Ancylomarina euxinus TaxID=2283627 RepID=A0A425Y7X9_9BACT|nr:ATP synthase F1 subunit gamma [Ancylomarina euxinus]MCZ4693554.1 ATP synthase F1 subunit gamma [Ancylomarina euxinus]MUP13781.1 ATP synthase F1 subunit gamma [Ancylomarina euxinus]RRG24583.1 ATP synthase F1 subunit gamma [Ancylomarina euxinus]
MANLKEIRTRISSVEKTKQVTAAMKMVSAAKLKKAQDAIVQIRPYADKLQEILGNLSGSLSDSEDNIYGAERKADKVLLVAITSNKGLCGAFNSNVLKRVNELSRDVYSKQKAEGNFKVLAIGKQGFKDISKVHQVIVHHNELFDDMNFENTSSIASSIMEEYVAGKYDRVELVYNRFKNAGVQILTNEQFLPIVTNDSDADTAQSDYIFEPGKEAIIGELIPKSLKTQFFGAMLDSVASEHGARMTSMHKATDNASDLIQEMKLHYNQARQAAITNEILEIVSGANALSQ